MLVYEEFLVTFCLVTVLKFLSNICHASSMNSISNSSLLDFIYDIKFRKEFEKLTNSSWQELGAKI